MYGVQQNIKTHTEQASKEAAKKEKKSSKKKGTHGQVIRQSVGSDSIMTQMLELVDRCHMVTTITT